MKTFKPPRLPIRGIFFALWVGLDWIFSFQNPILAIRKQNNDDRSIYTEAAQYF